MESPAGSYTQVIPSLDISPRQAHRHGLPPSLPPQLLQVLLTMFTPVSLMLMPGHEYCFGLKVFSNSRAHLVPKEKFILVLILVIKKALNCFPFLCFLVDIFYRL